MASPHNPEDKNRPVVPQIQVDNFVSPSAFRFTHDKKESLILLQGDDQAEEITPTSPSRSPMTEIGSPSNLSAVPSNYRGRSMSGSTVYSSGSQGSQLDVPKSAGGESVSSATISGYSDEDPLRPEQGTEYEFVVEDNRFAFSPGQLNKLLNPKSTAAFVALGGLRGLERGLRTDRKTGLSIDETSLDGTVSFEEATTKFKKGQDVQPSTTGQAHHASTEAFVDRIRIFRRNKLPEKKPTPLWKLVWQAYNDKILILLTAAAVISLALGLYETFGVDHPPGSPPPIDWVVSSATSHC